jgi:hypothetical protein
MSWMTAIAWLWICGGVVEAQSLTCPASIVTKQEAQSAPTGWTVGRADVPTNLAGITFYSGPPEERASLIYDSRVTRGGLLYATWKFAGAASGGKDAPAIWLSCNYMSTNVVMSRRIAAGIRECTVTYDPKATVAGMPAVRGIVCK